MEKHNLDMEQYERAFRNLLKVWIGLLVVAIAVLVCLIGAEEAKADTRKPAVCQVWSEDGAWVYDTCKITVENFEKHHVAMFKQGRKMKVYATKNGWAKIKHKGKTAWISSKVLDVKKAGWVKLEGHWRKVKPGFDFYAYFRLDDEQND